MGRESLVERNRVCKECQREWYMTAKELGEHAKMCKRMQAVGLELPNHEQPQLILPPGVGE